ncbi:hypothetical protein ABB26_04920 [Stenotrophomonas humi]|uniref:Transmembrane protein n=1 Tax=Stenotrophomonas humi TaxID=405444 RepID=A0A0R0C601_9GAMM|nr:hypothetical protein [Stenotrophomonas humi]KRG65161.1 hypothetical protein ABB26_04920 [Stenotrophomonas humi]
MSGEMKGAKKPTAASSKGSPFAFFKGTQPETTGDPKAGAEAAAKVADAVKGTSEAEERTDRAWGKDDYAFFSEWLKAAVDPEERLTVGRMYSDMRDNARARQGQDRDGRSRLFKAALAVTAIAVVGTGYLGVQYMKSRIER